MNHMSLISNILRYPSSKPVLPYIFLAFYPLIGLVSFALIHGYSPPVVHDEFAYLLTADTFVQGRLTNQPPPFKEFFSTFHVITSNFYNGKYPPGQGLQLALGQVLGHPLHGVWITIVLWSCSLYWLFKTMAPPATAFWGGVLFVPFFSFLSYHGQSYWGGSLGALGGALTLGGILYCWDNIRIHAAILCGVGLGLLQMTRPMEGLIFCSVPLVAISLKYLKQGNAGIRPWVLKFFFPMLVPLFMGISFHLIYNWANTGHALQLPYMSNNSSDVMRWGAPENLFAGSLGLSMRSIQAWRAVSPLPWYFAIMVGILSIAGLLSTCTYHRQLDGSAWLVVACLGSIGVAIWGSQSFSRTVWPHYVSAWSAPAGLLAMIGWRSMIEWPSSAMKVISIVFTVLVLLVLGSTMYLTARHAALINPSTMVGKHWNCSDFGRHRQTIKERLLTFHQKSGLQQIVFVKYGQDHEYHKEWIYNDADIFHSPVIWARDLGAKKNNKLRSFVGGHWAWSLYIESDDQMPVLTPF